MKNKKLLRTAAMFLCVMMAGSSIPSVPAYVYAEEAQNGDETAAQKETIRINTIEDLKKFTSSLREVIEYIKYSKDKEKLSRILKDNSRMLIDREAALVIKTITNTAIEISEKEEKIDNLEIEI